MNEDMLRMESISFLESGRRDQPEEEAFGAMRADRDISSHHTMQTVALSGPMHSHDRQMFPPFVKSHFDR